jgi:hypothetical protein
MKKIFILSMLIFCTMICSCQKQDPVAEQQLAQRKADLDARERALDERMDALNERVDALDQRVNALAEAEKAANNAGQIPPGVQGQTADAAQLEAEKDRRIQEAAAARAQMLDPSQLEFEKAEKAEKTEKEKQTQERLAQFQRNPQDVERQRRRKWEISQSRRMSDAGGSPVPETSSQSPLPATEATSPATSPTPQ